LSKIFITIIVTAAGTPKDASITSRKSPIAIGPGNIFTNFAKKPNVIKKANKNKTMLVNSFFDKPKTGHKNDPIIQSNIITILY